ncbi:MAG TPA: HD domain-containing phosphohydrolase, partial [Candidatus Omnitrophota bacterium]|nr:HD domain-containing phosphohydrolase [Candidatus Omnitrophota bacterium]
EQSFGNGEFGFLSALLRQLGITLVAWNYPAAFDRALKSVTSTQPLTTVLSSMLGFSPELLAASLVRQWGGSSELIYVVGGETALTKDEYERVKEHSVTGAAILYPIRELGDIAREVRGHHERYDGTGYPDGLKEEDIPFVARIIAVADTFDAITSDRPYRQRKMAEIAMQIIRDNSGTQFDPIVVSAFLLAYRKNRFQGIV